MTAIETFSRPTGAWMSMLLNPIEFFAMSGKDVLATHRRQRALAYRYGDCIAALPLPISITMAGLMLS